MEYKFKNNSDWVNITILLALALVVRLFALEQIHLISRDGITYVSLAKVYWLGSFSEGLAHPYHPLYPMIMALVGGVTGDFELAGKLVSFVLTTLTVIPVYLIGKTLYDSNVGLIGGVFFVFQPYCVRFSVDVLSDPAFIFFFVLAFYWGIKAGKEATHNKLWSLGAGISGGLAYLIRPEGILVILFLAGWYFFEWALGRRKTWTNFLSLFIIMVFAFLTLSAPYIFLIKTQTGKWQISQKASVIKMTETLKLEPNEKKPKKKKAPAAAKKEKRALSPKKPREPIQRGDVWRSITRPALKFVETYHYLLFLFFLLGLWPRVKRESRPSGWLVLVFTAGYLLILSYLYYTVSYVSRRHVLPLIVFTLPVAGAGFWEVRQWALLLMERFNCKWSKSIPTIVILLLTLFILIPKALKPQGEDKLPLKEAGFWIKGNCRKELPVIMSNEPLIAYYAGGKHVSIPRLSYQRFETFVDEKQVDYLVLGERDIKRGKKFLSLLQPERFRKVLAKDKEVLIYEITR